MPVSCEDCRFASWDAALFRDRKEVTYDGMHAIPPYSEQFDLYCNKHKRFYLETEITDDCQDGEYGPNNFHEVCKEHYRQKEQYLKELKIKKFKARYVMPKGSPDTTT